MFLSCRPGDRSGGPFAPAICSRIVYAACMGLDRAQRVLVFGGTFDPPHIAHARLPDIIARQLGCDCIIYVPARVSPHKLESPPTADEHRLAMLTLAIADVPNACVSTVELDRPGPSYMVDTLRQLRAADADGNGDTQWLLLIGADQALLFDTWKDWREIMTLAQPIVMLRPPMTREAFAEAVSGRFDPEIARTWQEAVVEVPAIDVSATTLRDRLARGASVDGWLDPAVAAYIAQTGLYR